jgi:hypothetical protein
VPETTISITPAPVIDLPHPLYLLLEEKTDEGGSLWQLKPGTQQAEELRLVDEGITCFDISPTDGSLAFGTYQGRIYVQSPGKEPQLVVDTSIRIFMTPSKRQYIQRGLLEFGCLHWMVLNPHG